MTTTTSTGALTLDATVERARRGAALAAALPVFEHARVLRTAADAVEAKRDHLASLIAELTGKVLKDSLREVERVPWTLRLSATAAEGLRGEQIPGDAVPMGVRSLGVTIHQPVGVVGAITPFNAPLNLAAHKVGPAFAAGNAVIVKPSPRCPEVVHELVTILHEAGVPEDALVVFEGGDGAAVELAAHPGVDLVTLTGSPAAGEAIRAAAAFKRVLLELGGNSANLVHRDADLDVVVPAVLRGGFANQGQSCNSVQRLIVHESVARVLEQRLVAAMEGLRIGEAKDPDTDVGPVIDDASADRIAALVDDAAARGARIRTSGVRAGRVIPPTLVVDPPADARLLTEEVFGPVVVLLPYRTLDRAIEIANNTRFGLQAAVFTQSTDVAWTVGRRLRCGGVVVNESSNFRLDHVPFGGSGLSGQGREGPAEAIREYTETKTVLFVLPSAVGGRPGPDGATTPEVLP